LRGGWPSLYILLEHGFRPVHHPSYRLRRSIGPVHQAPDGHQQQAAGQAANKANDGKKGVAIAGGHDENTGHRVHVGSRTDDKQFRNIVQRKHHQHQTGFAHA